MSDGKFTKIDTVRHPLILWTLWGALTMSLFIYALVAYIISLNTSPDQSPQTVSTLMVLLGIVAAGETVFIFLFPRIYFKNSNGNFMTLMIVRLALAESICIYGFVVRIMGASWIAFCFFWVWSMVLMLVLMPTKMTLENFLRIKYQKKREYEIIE